MKLFSDTVHKASFKVIAVLGVVAGMVLAEAAPAKAQAMQLLYIYPGVTDNGGAANTGVATSFHCSNFSGANQSVQVVVFAPNGLLLANVTRVAPNNNTLTFSTHQTFVFTDAGNELATGPAGQGSAFILAESLYVICTAQVVDAAASVPSGIQLHGIRYTPIPGTQE